MTSATDEPMTLQQRIESAMREAMLARARTAASSWAET
jgi:hypothetical protein